MDSRLPAHSRRILGQRLLTELRRAAPDELGHVRPAPDASRLPGPAPDRGRRGRRRRGGALDPGRDASTSANAVEHRESDRAAESLHADRRRGGAARCVPRSLAGHRSDLNARPNQRTDGVLYWVRAFTGIRGLELPGAVSGLG